MTDSNSQDSSSDQINPIDPPLSSSPSARPMKHKNYTKTKPPRAEKSGSVIGAAIKRVAVLLISGIFLLSLAINVYLGIIVAASIGSGLGEEIYAEGDPESRVVILNINGPIDAEMAGFSHDAWKHLMENPPKAVVLRVTSGGGGITASDQMHHHLKVFKAANPDVPIVASFGSVAASGGYYISAPADYIMAERTTITGSIGVIAQLLTFEGSLDKLGIEPVTLTATGSPDKDKANTLYRTWDEADLAVIQGLLDHSYQVFQDVVYEGRFAALGAAAPTREEIAAAASGAIYMSPKAKELKLIDDIGYLDQAVDQAISLAGIPSSITPQVSLLNKPVPFSLGGLLGGKRVGMGLPDSPEELRSWMTELGTLRLEYRMHVH